MPFHAFFSIAIMSSSTLLAGPYFRALHRPYSVDLLGDQHLGGGIAWALSEVPILLVVAAIFVQWVRADHRESRRLDRTADRAEARGVRRAAGEATPDEPDELTRYNAYLAALADHESTSRRGGPERR
jgi:putative copper resistance protein D